MLTTTRSPLFEVALVEPEIPNNTGNIGRTCVATGCSLHLVHPLGFDITEKACRRAGLDYWPRLQLREHESWPAFESQYLPTKSYFLSTKAKRSIYEVSLQRGDCLIFGKETAGLSPEIIEKYSTQLVRLPMIKGERSLNLATAVCAVVYEGLRQLMATGQVEVNSEGQIVL